MLVRKQDLSFLATLATVCLLFALSSQAAEIEHESDPDTGIETWKLNDQGVALIMRQITPDQATAFFLGRGFVREAADRYAATCVFMTVVRNESAAGPVSYRVADWSYMLADGKHRRLKSTREWLEEWRKRNVPESSLIAFEWSQHPPEQTFEIGDWNQGMTSFDLAPGSRFNLRFRWEAKGEMHESLLRDLRCAQSD